jgi:hypothetical protein
MQFADEQTWLRFCSEMIARGVCMHRPQFPTMSHTLADVRQTLDVAAAVCAAAAV